MPEICFAAWGDFVRGNTIGDAYEGAAGLLSAIGYDISHIGVAVPGYSNSKLSQLAKTRSKILSIPIDVSAIDQRSSLELVSSPSKEEPALKWTAYLTFAWRGNDRPILTTEEAEESFRKSKNFIFLQIKKI